MNKVVGKLSQIIDANNELEAAEALAALPHANLYFVLADPTSYCKPKPLHEQKDTKGVRSCEFIQRQGTEGIIHYLMPYGGLSIKPHIEQSKKVKPLPVLGFFKRLLEAGALLAIRGYVHYDLHLGNLLLDAKTSLPRLIDFGMSFSAKEIDQETLDGRWKEYVPDFGPEPPEVTVITGVYRNKIPYRTCLQDIGKMKETLRLAERYVALSRNQQLRDFHKFWTTSQAVQRQDWVGFFKLYWPAFDAWGIGYILINIFRLASQNSTLSEQPDWTAALPRVKDILRGLLRMDPRLRLDCVEALQLLDPENPILESAPGRAWIQERETIRASFKA